MELIKVDRKIELDKRMCVPYVIYDNCDSCGSKLSKDYSCDQYFSYPIEGEPIEFCLYCGHCDHENIRSVKIEIKLTKC